MAQVVGVVFVKINGAILESKEASIEFGGDERTEIMANGRVVGFAEQPIPCVVACTLAFTVGTQIDAVRAFRNGALTFETDAGPVFLVSGAFASTPGSLSSGEGDYEVEFKGQAALQIV